MGYKLKRVRYSILPSNCFIQWHYDNDFNSIKNTRIHIPIITNDNVIVNISGKHLNFKKGNMYTGDFSFPHQVYNGSNHTRIHLIIDIKTKTHKLFKFSKNNTKRLALQKKAQKLLNKYVDNNINPKDRYKKEFSLWKKKFKHNIESENITEED